MQIDNILIIEGDDFHRNVLCSVFSFLQDKTIQASPNGHHALEQVKRFKPDLVLCDLFMPKMDGIAFIRELSKIHSNCCLVLVSSAQGDIQQTVIEMARQLGFAGIMAVEKPIVHEDLRDILDWASATGSKKPFLVSDKFNPSSEELQRGIDNSEFEPFFQGHYDSLTGEIIGAEALLRWNHPQKGILTPHHFLKELLDHDKQKMVARMMIEKSIAQLKLWHKTDLRMGVSVNVTQHDLIDDGFVAFVLQALDHYNCAPSNLTLEITETEICSDTARLMESTSRLRMNGVKLSIDDYGIGHSTLAQLIFSPFTEIKIDQFFVANMLENNKHMAAVKCTISLAKNLGLRTVAEGVETQEQAIKLSQLGADVLQGYYLAKPISSIDFENNVKQSALKIAP